MTYAFCRTGAVQQAWSDLSQSVAARSVPARGSARVCTRAPVWTRIVASPFCLKSLRPVAAKSEGLKKKAKRGPQTPKKLREVKSNCSLMRREAQEPDFKGHSGHRTWRGPDNSGSTERPGASATKLTSPRIPGTSLLRLPRHILGRKQENCQLHLKAVRTASV